MEIVPGRHHLVRSWILSASERGRLGVALNDGRLSWARTKGKRLTTLRGFFRCCRHRKWLMESLGVAPIRTSASAAVSARLTLVFIVERFV